MYRLQYYWIQFFKCYFVILQYTICMISNCIPHCWFARNKFYARTVIAITYQCCYLQYLFFDEKHRVCADIITCLEM